MKHILLVEDDIMIASGLVYALEQEAYSVTHCQSIADALVKIADAGTDSGAGIAGAKFDLAILDMQLPDGTGSQVHEALKQYASADSSAIPAVIFLTVVDDEGNIVRAFEHGADDYITKPFRLRELLARIKRVLNTPSNTNTSNANTTNTTMLTLGNVSIDTAAGKAYLNDTLLDLTALEYRLLLTFATSKGQLLTRAQILESIWDSAGNFVEDNTLTVYMKRLREKLGDAAQIETVRGMGYRAN